MTVVRLTDKDYEIIHGGDQNEIKRLVNELRGNIADLKFEPACTFNFPCTECPRADFVSKRCKII